MEKYIIYNNINNNMGYESNVIIIARYDENLKWVFDVLKHKWIEKIIIYNKGFTEIPEFEDDRVVVINKKNIGREGETYLDYIIQNYDELPENLWFTQGNPFVHSPDFLELFDEKNVDCYINKDMQSLTLELDSTHTVWKYPPSTDINNAYDINNAHICKYIINKNDHQIAFHNNFYDHIHNETVISHFYNIYNTNSVTDKLCEIIGVPLPTNLYIEYIWAAIFFVKKQKILSNDINCYKKLYNFLFDGGYTGEFRYPHSVSSQGGIQGYVLERFWNYLFTKKNYMSCVDCYKEIFDFPKIKYLAYFCFTKKELYLYEKNLMNINIIPDKYGCILFMNNDNVIKKLPLLKINGNSIKIIKAQSLDNAELQLKNILDNEIL
jgi:hypothetical protein